MIIPKSSAPRLIRLASMPKINIMERVKNNASGIMEAITNAERKLPSSNNTTRNTMMQPKIRFSKTVNVVLPISSLRSRIGLI